MHCKDIYPNPYAGEKGVHMAVFPLASYHIEDVEGAEGVLGAGESGAAHLSDLGFLTKLYSKTPKKSQNTSPHLHKTQQVKKKPGKHLGVDSKAGE